MKQMKGYRSLSPGYFPELSLRSLTITLGFEQGLLQNLLDRNCLRHLRSLRYAAFHLQELNNVLEKHGDSLLVLELYPFSRMLSNYCLCHGTICRSINPSFSIGDPIQWSSCTRLQHIVLYINLAKFLPDQQHAASIDIAICYIEGVCSSLRKVTLIFIVFCDKESVREVLEPLIDWQRLGTALQSHKSLREVDVKFYEGAGAGQLQGEALVKVNAWVGERLACYLKQGHLSLTMA